MLARLFRPVQRAARAATDAPVPAPAPIAPASPADPPPLTAYSKIAVIAGRHCLAYQGTACSVCVEHCPVPGALLLEGGLPRVVPEVCTGCELCHEVCPAPDSAVRLVPRPPGLAAPRPAA